MVFTNDDYLPSYEELTVPEIDMSSAPLKAGAIYFGKYCDDICKEYMLCSQEEKDPRKCLREGKAVTACGVEFFNKVKATCAESFTKYWKCIDDAGPHMEHRYCRKSQAVFSNCLKEKIGLEQPELGYFAMVRVHKTSRPKPDHNVPLPEPLPEIAVVGESPLTDKARRMAQFGNRQPY